MSAVETPRTPLLAPRDLPGLTSLRAVAALMVFAYHASAGVPLKIGGPGYTGVAFFFVLSGFVLTWGTDPRGAAGTFFLRRFARIYPSHLVMWLLVLALPIVSGPQGGGHALLNLLLLQAWSPRTSDVFSMNGVTWSLSCEFLFYAIFPALFALTLKTPLRVVWVVAIAAFVVATGFVATASFADPQSHVALIAGANPLVRCPEFIIGIAGARTIQSGRAVTSWAIGLVAIWAVGGLAVAHGSPVGASWLAPVFLLVIMSVASAATRGRELFSGGWMVYAGKVSFCFYLVHQLVLKEVFHVWGLGWGPGAGALLLSFGFAAALHHGVEKPAHRAIVTRFSAAKRTTPSDAVAE